MRLSEDSTRGRYKPGNTKHIQGPISNSNTWCVWEILFYGWWICVKLMLSFMSFVIPPLLLFTFRPRVQYTPYNISVAESTEWTTHHVTHNAAETVSRWVIMRLMSLEILPSRGGNSSIERTADEIAFRNNVHWRSNLL